MSCCKIGKGNKTILVNKIDSAPPQDWPHLGRELGKKWLSVTNLLREIEGKMREFQKRGKFKLEFKNKFDSNF